MNNLQHPNNYNIVLKYKSITHLRRTQHVRAMNGSSRFRGYHNCGGFEEKPDKQNESLVIDLYTPKFKKIHKVNKTRVREKSLAFSKLKMSKKFMAFYTISFPQRFSDKQGQRVLNNVLTRIRSISLPFNYLWVAERQKNGTIHFHILINRWLNVRVFNHLVARAIQTVLVKDKSLGISYIRSKYNGVDAKKVYKISHLQSYITKYITKSNATFDVRAWGTDRATSALFVSITVTGHDMPFFQSIVGKNKDKKPLIFEHQYFLHIMLSRSLSGHKIRELEIFNQQIADIVMYA